VTGSSLALPLGRPEKRVTARSKPCQKKCIDILNVFLLFLSLFGRD
jgi:hypothetical protein